LKDIGCDSFKVAVCSGKGGTGKTTLALCLAWTLGQASEFDMPVKLLDADVEEPNCHLFLRCDYSETTKVKAEKPVFDLEKCIGCGKCARKCRYNAIAVVKGQPLVFNDLCHSCGVCAAICPKDAIKLSPEAIGTIYADEEHKPYAFAYGSLNIGESQSPMVIDELLKKSLTNGVTIIDGPPGTGCPTVKTLANADKVILVTEPTPFGAHDLSLALNLCSELSKPCGIFINRSDENDVIIEELAERHQVKIIGRIPFKREYARTCSEGSILAAEFPSIREISIASFLSLLENAKIPLQIEPEKIVADGSFKVPTENGQGNVPYQEITILSGKGGTGKTTVAAAFADLAESRIFADCDVDAANLKLLLNGNTLYSQDIRLGHEAQIDQFKCTKCGICAENCRFKAIYFDEASGRYLVNSFLCEGCGLCREICPGKAIAETTAETGKLMVSEATQGTLVHADLATAAENSGKLVSMVRDLAAAIMEQQQRSWLIADGPPGTACPAIASVTGTDRVILVTEPSVAALHDLVRVSQLIKHFGLTPQIIINKADINGTVALKIKELAQQIKAEVLGEIPFDPSVKEAIKAGKPLTLFSSGPAATAIKEIWNKIKEKKS
jgi:MinD superfamily P-loop ATPase